MVAEAEKGFAESDWIPLSPAMDIVLKTCINFIIHPSTIMTDSNAELE